MVTIFSEKNLLGRMGLAYQTRSFMKYCIRTLSSLVVLVGSILPLPVLAADGVSGFVTIAQKDEDYDRLLDLCYKGNGEEALAACDRALEIDPSDPTTWTNRGVHLGNLGRYEEALSSHDRAIELNPDYSLALANRAFALSGLERYEEAMQSCQSALDKDGEWGEGAIAGKAVAWNNLGVAYYWLNRDEDALEAFEEAVSIDPSYTLAQENVQLMKEKLDR
jgi:tetratricopeptide (TPR) repeat protein